MSKVGKQELARRVAKQADLPVSTTQRVITQVFAAIAIELARGNSVTVTGFGTWRTKIRPPRAGRDPRDGRQLKIPARTRVAFRPGASLRDTVETSIDPEIFFGAGVARSTAIESALSQLFDCEAKDFDLEQVRVSIRELLGPAAEREAEEFFAELGRRGAMPRPD